ALASLAADSSSGTALWDAVVLGAKSLAAQPSDGRVIVVLSDGRDVTSTAKMTDAISAARQADVAVYPIGIAGPDYTPAPLRELASTTGGSYHEAGSSAELAAIYASVGRELHPASIWQAGWMPFVLSLFVGLLVLLACG